MILTDYGMLNLPPPLVKGMQEQQVMIEDLQKQINLVHEEIKKLKNKM
jgi:hypothetical protein